MGASAVAEAATLPTGVEGTFARNGSPFRYGMAAMDACAATLRGNLRPFRDAPQITRSFPPSTGTWAPVVFPKRGLAMAATMFPTSRDLISVLRRLRVLYSSIVMP